MYQRAPFLIFILAVVLPVVSPDPAHHPDPETLQPLKINASSPPATIPAFPEQSDFSGCPLDLPDQLFHSVKSACDGRRHLLHRGRCCPVLGAWLYSAYSSTALGHRATSAAAGRNNLPDEMPVLPDDSETCVDDVGKALRRRGIELARPNETCDVVYCYCGIRLHHLNCPEAFQVNGDGKLVGDESIERLEIDCLSSSDDVNGFPGLGGCNRCLTSLYKLNRRKPSGSSNQSSSEEAEDEKNRTIKMRNKDCELMGLTWLLAKNRTAYIRTVTSVLRAIMLNTDDVSEPKSCSLASDGMPLAVDSSEFSDHSSSPPSVIPRCLSFVLPPCLTLVAVLGRLRNALTWHHVID